MPRWFTFRNQQSEEEAELSIYDEIFPFWGVNANNFEQQLKDITAKDITVSISSPGGAVFEGYAIANMLINHPANIKVRVMGVAGSIASVIAMAANPGQLFMPENSMLFIHDPSWNMGGTAKELRKTANTLDDLKGGIISTYMRHYTGDRKELEAAMEEETWYTAAMAKESFGAVVEPMVQMAAKFEFKDYYPHTLNPFSNGKTASEVEEPQPKPQPKQKGDKMSKELEAQVTSLTAEKEKLITDHKVELDTVKNSAVEEAKKNEQKRKKDILAIRDKYSKDGDLDKIAVDALATDISVDEFKDKVLEHIAENRTTKPANKPGEGQEQNPSGDEPTEDTIDGCRALINKTDDPEEKGRLASVIRKLRGW